MSIDRDIIKDSGLCFGVIIIKMKGSKFMCASPASTAVCMGMEHRSVVSPGGRVLDKRKLLDRQRSRVSETHQGRTHEYHYNRNGEHSRDGRHQRACVGHTTSATKNMSTVGKAEQDLSAIIPTSHLSHHPKSSVSNEMMVVMRVSLHCKSCAGKVRKHISKMEGVTSFIIELEQKKVTVMGNVSPMEVLESISKVKNAEFWPTSNNF